MYSMLSKSQIILSYETYERKAQRKAQYVKKFSQTYSVWQCKKGGASVIGGIRRGRASVIRKVRRGGASDIGRFLLSSPGC